MNDPRRFWLVVALFLLFVGFLSALMGRPAREAAMAPGAPGASRESSVTPSFQKNSDDDYRVDPIRGKTGDQSGVEYFQR